MNRPAGRGGRGALRTLTAFFLALLLLISACTPASTSVAAKKTIRAVNPLPDSKQIGLAGSGAELRLSVREGIPYPAEIYCAGFADGAAVAQGLEELYEPILSAMEPWFTDSGLSFEHRLTTKDTELYLESTLSDGETSVPVVSVTISRSGVITLIEPIPEEALSDADFMEAAAAFLKMGIAVDLSSYGKKASLSLCLELFVTSWEDRAGHAVDASRITGTVDDDLMRKAYALNLLRYYDGVVWNPDETVDMVSLLDMLAVWLTSLESDVRLLDSDPVSGEYLAEIAGLWYRCLSVSKYEIPSISENVANEARSLTEITRLDLARVLVPIWEEAFGEIDPSDRALEPPRDCDDISAIKAVSASLVNCWPAWNTFEPSYTIRYRELEALLSTAASRIYIEVSGWGTEILTVSQLTKFVYEARLAFEDVEPANEPYRTVSLSRSWEWYVNQYETGSYGAINCMPSCTAMILKWLDAQSTVTAEELRLENLDRNEGGWYMYEVEEALTSHGAEFEPLDASIGNIISAIDSGHIVFSQINEGDVELEGHCFVIYGYRLHGENIEFLTHDPASALVNAEGEPEGKGRAVEAHYAEWIIRRFNPTCLEIIPETEE